MKYISIYTVSILWRYRVAKRKPKSIAALVNDAATRLQRIVRLKAADENGYATCVTCGQVEHYKDMDGGHFISRVYTAHKLCEEQIHPQCRRCNNWLNGNQVPYTLFMIETYGQDFVEHLEATKRETKKYSRPEIMEIIEDMKHYEKQVRETKGLI